VIPKSYSITGYDCHRAVHLLIGWWAEGVLDIGFSLCTVPTYGLVSEYFGVEEPRFGVDAEGHSARVQASCKAMPQVIRFRVQFRGQAPRGE